MNNKNYRFYLTNEAVTRILSGWEFKDDALDAQNEATEPTKIYMASYLKRAGMNPELNESWKGIDKNRVVLTGHELWLRQAPAWNFELNEEQLINKALVLGFVTKIGEDSYEINQDY